MYAPPPRLSILQRPLRPEGGQANLENADREHEKLQARIAAKAAKREEYEERLVEAYYPTAEARRRTAEAARREAERMAAAKAQVEAEARAAEAAWLSQPQHVYVDSQRPYVATTTTYWMPPEVEAGARREAQRRDAEVNRHAAAVRALEVQAARVAEQAAVRSTLQAEDNWFNRGAASERWLPPERRVHRRGGAEPPLHLATGPPPFFAEDSPPGSRASSRAPSVCASPAAPYATHPWADRAAAAAASGRWSGPATVEGVAGAAPLPARPSTAPAVGPSPPGLRANPARLREGEGARAALSHDIAAEREASASARAAAARRAAAAAGERSYPWSWQG